MKIVCSLAVLFACFSGAFAKWGGPLGSPSVSRVLTSARGGGDGILGTPVTTDILAALYITEAAVGGSLGVPFAENSSSLYGNDPLPAGGIEAFCVRTASYTKLNNALYTFLTVFKDMPAESAIAYSTLTCSSAMTAGVLTGDFEALGFKKGFGTASLLAFLGCQYAIFSGGDYATLGAQVLAGYHVVVGALGYAFPEKAAELLGVDVKGESKTSFYRNALSAPLLQIGVGYAAALNGASAAATLSYRALLEAGTTLIGIVRKEGDRLKLPEKTLYALLAISSIVGIGTQLAVQDEE